jgi:hypothetical protein
MPHALFSSPERATALRPMMPAPKNAALLRPFPPSVAPVGAEIRPKEPALGDRASIPGARATRLRPSAAFAAIPARPFHCVLLAAAAQQNHPACVGRRGKIKVSFSSRARAATRRGSRQIHASDPSSIITTRPVPAGGMPRRPRTGTVTDDSFLFRVFGVFRGRYHDTESWRQNNENDVQSQHARSGERPIGNPAASESLHRSRSPLRLGRYSRSAHGAIFLLYPF